MDKDIFRLHAEVCKALSSAKRLEILSILRGRERSVGEIAGLMQVSKANVSQHLAVMRKAGIVDARREGVSIHYRIADPKVIRACDLMREVLIERQAQTSRMMRRFA